MGDDKDANDMIVVGKSVPSDEELVSCVENMISVCSFIFKKFLNKDVVIDDSVMKPRAVNPDDFQLYYIPKSKCKGPDFKYKGPCLFLQNNLIPLAIPIVPDSKTVEMKRGKKKTKEWLVNRCPDDSDSEEETTSRDHSDSQPERFCPSPIDAMFQDDEKNDPSYLPESDPIENGPFLKKQKKASRKSTTKCSAQNQTGTTPGGTAASKWKPVLDTCEPVSEQHLADPEQEQCKSDVAESNDTTGKKKRKRESEFDLNRCLNNFFKSLHKKDDFCAPHLHEPAESDLGRPSKKARLENGQCLDDVISKSTPRKQSKKKKKKNPTKTDLDAERKLEMKACIDNFLQAFVAQSVELSDISDKLVSPQNEQNLEKELELSEDGQIDQSATETGTVSFDPDLLSHGLQSAKRPSVVHDLLNEISDLSDQSSNTDDDISISSIEDADECSEIMAMNLEQDFAVGWGRKQYERALQHMRTIVESKESVTIYDVHRNQSCETVFTCSLQSSLLVFEDGEVCILNLLADLYKYPPESFTIDRIGELSPQSFKCVPKCPSMKQFSDGIQCRRCSSLSHSILPSITWGEFPEHVRFHNESTILFCPYAPHCNLFFFSKAQRNAHLDEHRCGICNAVNPEKEAVSSHYAVHDAPKIPMSLFCGCLGCPRYFHARTALLNHILEAHKCANCLRLFDPDELLHHKKICTLKNVESKLAKRSPYFSEVEVETLSNSFPKVVDSETSSPQLQAPAKKSPGVTQVFPHDCYTQSVQESKTPQFGSHAHLEGTGTHIDEVGDASAKYKSKDITKATTGQMVEVQEFTFVPCNRLEKPFEPGKQKPKISSKPSGISEAVKGVSLDAVSEIDREERMKLAVNQKDNQTVPSSAKSANGNTRGSAPKVTDSVEGSLKSASTSAQPNVSKPVKRAGSVYSLLPPEFLSKQFSEPKGVVLTTSWSNPNVAENTVGNLKDKTSGMSALPDVSKPAKKAGSIYSLLPPEFRLKEISKSEETTAETVTKDKPEQRPLKPKGGVTFFEGKSESYVEHQPAAEMKQTKKLTSASPSGVVHLPVMVIKDTNFVDLSKVADYQVSNICLNLTARNQRGETKKGIGSSTASEARTTTVSSVPKVAKELRTGQNSLGPREDLQCLGQTAEKGAKPSAVMKEAMVNAKASSDQSPLMTDSSSMDLSKVLGFDVLVSNFNANPSIEFEKQGREESIGVVSKKQRDVKSSIGTITNCKSKPLSNAKGKDSNEDFLIEEFETVRPIEIPEKFRGKKLRVVNTGQKQTSLIWRNVPLDKRFIICQCCRQEFDHASHLVEHIKDHCRKPETIPSFILKKLKPSKAVLHVLSEVSLFLCSECGMCFHLMDIFSKHKRAHQELVFPCRFCGMRFRHTSEIELHVKYFHPSNKNAYLCELCCMSFPGLSALQEHVSRCHDK